MAGKKQDMAALIAAREFKSFLKALEVEEKSTIILGETMGPLMDLYETADDIVVEIDLPGMHVDDVDVYISKNILTIEGIKREKIEEEGRINYLCMERCFEAFRRIVKLDMPINPHGARAVYSRGVLVLNVPKIKEQRGKVVRVKVETNK